LCDWCFEGELIKGKLKSMRLVFEAIKVGTLSVQRLQGCCGFEGMKVWNFDVKWWLEVWSEVRGE
jgi:hypothetical protein